MEQSSTSARPVVLVGLEGAPAGVLEALAARTRSTRVRLPASDVISAQSLRDNRVLSALLAKTKRAGGRLHLIALLSDASALVSFEHLSTVLSLAREAQVRVVVHTLLDGVDGEKHGAGRLVAQLESQLLAGARIGTVSGRAFSLDYDGRWERIEKLFRALTADGAERVDSAALGITEACAFGNTENFVKPFLVFDYPGISPVDAALCLNFQSPGGYALAEALAGGDFPHFVRKGGRGPFEGRFASLVPYGGATSGASLFARAPDLVQLASELPECVRQLALDAAQGEAAMLGESLARALGSARFDLITLDFAELADPRAAAALLERALPVLLGVLDTAQAPAFFVSGRDAANAARVYYLDPQGTGASLREDAQLTDLLPSLCQLLRVRAPDEVGARPLLVSSAA